VLLCNDLSYWVHLWFKQYLHWRQKQDEIACDIACKTRQFKWKPLVNSKVSNRNDSICGVTHKVAKVSTIVTVACRCHWWFWIKNIANVNGPLWRNWSVVNTVPGHWPHISTSPESLPPKTKRPKLGLGPLRLGSSKVVWPDREVGLYGASVNQYWPFAANPAKYFQLRLQLLSHRNCVF